MNMLLVVFLYIFVIDAKMQKCPSNHLCQCGPKKGWYKNRFIAICDGKKLKVNLEKIPVFPKETTDVVFINNNLRNISTSTLDPLNHLPLTSLSLKNNSIYFIKSDAFYNLKHLEELDISRNNMSQKDVSMSLYQLPAKLKRLKLNHMLWHPFDKGMFDGLSHTRVYKIELSHSYLNPFNGTWFQNLIHLRQLDISWNSINDYDLNMTGLYKLQWLNLEGNWINNIPDFCRDNITNLKRIFLSNTKLFTINNIWNQSNCLKILEYITLNGLFLRIIPNRIFENLPSLRTILMNKMSTQLARIQPYAFSSLSLKNLTFSRADGFRFSKSMADMGFFNAETIFEKCPNLVSLDLSRNVIDFTSLTIRQMFNPLKKLKNIWLESLYLAYMPTDLFHRLPSLEMISFEDNMIKPWEDGSLFNGLKNLKTLNLKNNQIGMIYPTSFPEKNLRNLTTLDLNLNLFSCNCDLMWFRDWIKRTKIRIVGKSKYKCNDLKTKLLNYNPTIIECNILTISVSVGCGIGLVLTITVLIYCCRWRIRFQLYSMRSFRRKYQQLDENRSIYAAYVIYCYEDLLWIKNMMIPKIENNQGFKLCIPHRDFEVGKFFADNIVEHMDQSKTVIPVLSNNFARDEWCLFQLALAKNKLTQQGDCFIFPIMLQEIEFKNMNAALYNLIKMSNYGAWDEDETAMQLFWEQVLDHLRNTA